MKDPARTNQKLIEENAFLKQRIRELELSEPRAEDALRESEARYRTLFEQVAVGVAEIEIITGRFLTVNRRLCELFGRTEKELLATTYLAITHPDDLHLHEDKSALLLAGKIGHYTLEKRYLSKDGASIWVNITVSHPWKPGEKSGYNIVVVEDITERRRAEKALRESEAKFRALAESSSSAIFLIQGTKYIYINPAFESIIGYTMEDLADMNFWDFTHPDMRELIKNRGLSRLKGQSPPVRYEIKFIAKNGQEKWVDYSATVIELDNKPTIMGSTFDISARKQAEEALRESEQKYRRIAENMSDVVSEVDAQGIIRYTSPSYKRVFGDIQYEVIGRSAFDSIHPDDRDRVAAVYMEGIRTKTNREVEYRILHADGHYVWLRSSGNLFFDAAGELLGIIVTSIDITERKRIEKALQESEERFRMLSESARDTIWTMDMNLQYTYMNPYIKHVLDYTPEEYVAIPLNKTLTPSSLELCMQILSEELEIEKREDKDPLRSRTIEVEHIHRNGSIVWAEIKMTFIRNAAGQATGILGYTRDITERVRTEKALQESEKKYRLIAENMADVIAGLDMNLRFTYISPSIMRLRGFTVEEAMKETLDQAMTPESLKIALAAFEEEMKMEARGTADPDRIRTIELEEYRKDGSIIWVEISLSYMRDKDNKPVGILAVTRDITNRKRAENSLQKSEEMLRLITDNMSDMIRVSDLQGVNLYTSPSHFKGLGYRPEERVGKSAFDIIHPDDLEKVIKAFSEGLAANRPVSLEYRVRHADGHYVWLETVGDLLKDAQGKTTAVVMSSRDITDRKQVEEEKRSLEERLKRAEKMEALGQLAGGVAHDLNNVLGVLSGYSELLLLETPKGHRSRGHAEKILQSTEKGAAIIDDLLTLARRSVLVSDVINLNRLVSDFIKTPVFESMKDYHPRVTFRTEYDKNLLNIKGSPVHLEKTLMNLVSNAAESISGEGEVTIRTESRYLDKPLRGYDEVSEGDYAVITVSDTGMGIPAENREKIFEPFYTKKTMSRSGTGLGLAIVWGTVKDHHGYIDVQTEVGEGTTFTLYFPVTREEMVLPQQKETMERYMGKGEWVLVVDDVAEQRDVASGLLTRLGYEVHVVSSGEEAVEYLKQNKADILVLDMIMAPGIDGLETYQRVLRINPKQKAIIVSGFSETERVKEAQKLGAGAYVKKPYVMEKIGSAIRDELNR